MGSPRVTPRQIQRYFVLRDNGFTVTASAREVGISRTKAHDLEHLPRNGRELAESARSSKESNPVPLDQVCEAARLALDDLSGVGFAKRYFGIDLSPFQQSVWRDLEEAWASDERSYVCLNAPPGLGKSTVFVLFAAKRIVLNRAIRILFISRADSLAVRNTGRLRRALERVTPAVGAEATLSGDFGRFKPASSGELWTRPAYVVEQMDGSPIEEKEPTVSAFGFDSNYIGNRIDLLFGDDLDTTSTIRSPEVVENNRESYDGDLEPRLEERGLMVVGQQRLGPTDFSAHVLSKIVPPDDDDGLSETIEGEKKYHHIVYKVHYEDRCQGVDSHRKGSPAYPEGCLLDPERMPWRDVRTAMSNPQRFAVVYQQEETPPQGVLVKPVWVTGGRDPDTGEDHIGCWDNDRGLCELPKGLTPPLLSVVTVDPAASTTGRTASRWAFQWWVVHPASEQRFLMDCVKVRISADSLLDWQHSEGRFVGIMEDWQRRSEQVSFVLGQNVRISTWVLEAVGAFRFLQAYDHTKRWRRENNVTFVAHETHINKNDTQLGVTSIRAHWQYGRVRLPGKQGNPGRVAAFRLVEEVQRYQTDGRRMGSDDQVDANWMLEWNLPRLLYTLPREPLQLVRPTYMKGRYVA